MRKLEAELKKHANSDMYPFHMPGHKGRGDEIHQIDITEIDGFDNLHDPEDLILEEMEYAASYYGTKQTYFIVNGSTCSLLTAISAAIPFGGTLLLERGCHIAVYHAAYLRHLNLVYMDRWVKEENGRFIYTGEEEIDGVILTSPSYEGIVKPIQSYADMAHQLHAPLIVDEAHGAHFSMHPYFPESSISRGADLVVQSVHKTLPGMTQTSLLHRVSDLVEEDQIKRFIDIYETSSPSYVLLSSMTACIHLVSDTKNDIFDRYEENLKKLRHRLSNMKTLRLLGGEEGILSSSDRWYPYKNGMQVDPGKLCILTRDGGVNGAWLYDCLRDQYHLQPEMKGPDYVLLMTSVYDTEKGYERLAEALLEIDSSLEMKNIPSEMGQAPLMQSSDLPSAVMTIAKAMDCPGEWVPLSESVGRIARDYVILFPPDAPLIVPGERYTQQLIHAIMQYQKMGLSVTGMADDQVQVLPDDAK